MISFRKRILPELSITPPDKISPELVKELNQMIIELWDDFHLGNSEFKFIPVENIDFIKEGEFVLTKRELKMLFCTKVEGEIFYIEMHNFKN